MALSFHKPLFPEGVLGAFEIFKKPIDVVVLFGMAENKAQDRDELHLHLARDFFLKQMTVFFQESLRLGDVFLLSDQAEKHTRMT
jgi:hypothetical protein